MSLHTTNETFTMSGWFPVLPFLILALISAPLVRLFAHEEPTVNTLETGYNLSYTGFQNIPGSGDLRTTVRSFRAPDGGHVFYLRYLGGMTQPGGTQITKFGSQGTRNWQYQTSNLLISGAVPSRDGGVVGMHGGGLFLLDSSGRLTHQTNFTISYGGSWSDWDPIQLASGADGEVFVAGLSSGNLVVHKYVEKEGFRWARNYGPASGAAVQVVPAADGGCLILGRASDNSTWSVSLNSLGEVRWQRTWNISGARGIQLPNGRWLLAYTATRPLTNFTAQSHGGKDIWLLTVDNLGRAISNRSFGGSADDGFSEFFKDAAGVLFLLGTTASGPSAAKSSPRPASGVGTWLIKLDGDLEPKWDFTFETYGQLIDVPGPLLRHVNFRFESTTQSGSALITTLSESGNLLSRAWEPFTVPHPTNITTVPPVSTDAFSDLLYSYWAGGVFVVRFTPTTRDAPTLGKAGRDWRRIVSPGPEMNSVTYGRGKFVASSARGFIAVSTNGVDWAGAATLDQWITSIGFGLGRYVAVGTGGAMFTSVDANNWVKIPQPSTNSFSKVWGDEKSIIALGTVSLGPSPALILSTLDGSVWSRTVYEDTLLSSVAGSTERYVAVRGRTVAVTTNLTVWDGPITPNFLNAPYGGPQSVGDIAYGDGLFVTVGQCWCGPRTSYGTHSAIPATALSTNGYDWVLNSRSPGAAEPEYVHGYKSVAYGLGQFVAVGSSTGVSQDGRTWEETPTPDLGRSIAYGPGMFVIVGTTDFYVSGQLRPNPYLPAERVRMESDGSLRLTVESERGSRITVYSSPDLISWGPITNFNNAAGSAEVHIGPSMPGRKFFYRVSAD